MECLVYVHIREESLEGYKSISGVSKFNEVISEDDREMGYLLGQNDEMPYHLVVITRKLLKKLWAIGMTNRNEGALGREAVEDINLT